VTDEADGRDFAAVVESACTASFRRSVQNTRKAQRDPKTGRVLVGNWRRNQASAIPEATRT